MAPLPSAGNWLLTFAVFQKLVLTLFFSVEVDGHSVVTIEVFSKPLFTHRQLLNSLSLVFMYRLGHLVANSFSVRSFLLVFAPLMTGPSDGLVVDFQSFSERPLESAVRRCRRGASLPCYQVLVWHHCRQVFSSCSATQARSLPFSPP